MDSRQAALKSEIAQLSGAIDRQRSRMRGRGGHAARPTRHRSLVLSGSDEGGWVRRRTRQGVALVHRAVYDPARPPPVETPKAPAREQIVVDGVPFVFDESGTKLIKASLVAPHAPSATPRQTSVDGEAYVRTKSGNLISRALVVQRRAARAQQARQKRLAALGQQMGRVHRQVRARERAQICTFYTRTGACRRGDRCPFVHDPARRALCPGALKPSGCMLPPGTCLLSHTPTPHNTPHCVHFLRTGACRHGDACRYVHAARAADAPLCRPFVYAGWCEQGRACERRHAKECPDFREKGACSNAACRLAHPAPPPERSAVQGAEPAADTLFVRDDAAAAEERYFVAVDDAPPRAAAAEATPGTDARDFVQQHDYIDLDGEASLSDASVESEEPDSDAEVERTLGLV
ncbi:Similar to S.cerevisiae protein YTH1 (Essential RNA-binding component of cleavage and polyadenylation factor) [Malassezia sympodialis ATCC 42132]|uniref:Similar to S.cerevisiae protein YTH1 (Essential RNA-binding component of cleavage and polyadenylation factor) n=1 Tax=Malassezia sympodialis (strain ATCC 42132) TaxID=1230383 RepID=A0A1M8A6F8_MALS4|nr:Similar to S.cerevisiae protein YTH1 (Essential RNA-binding component of cleavage and polyadenylation factor) [Malassezia sympodialis ATCC 42132]